MFQLELHKADWMGEQSTHSFLEAENGKIIFTESKGCFNAPLF